MKTPFEVEQDRRHSAVLNAEKVYFLGKEVKYYDPERHKNLHVGDATRAANGAIQIWTGIEWWRMNEPRPAFYPVETYRVLS